MSDDPSITKSRETQQAVKLVLWQLAVVLVAMPPIYIFVSDSKAWSFLLGGLMLIFSLGIYGLAFILIIKQKFVALAPALIVSKYAILGLLILNLLKLKWVDSVWLGLGFCSIIFGALFGAWEQKLKERDDT